MKYLVTVICLLSLSGCATLVARMDANAAIQVAAKVNVENVKVMADGRMADRDAELAELETAFADQLGLSKGGADAVRLLSLYRKNKVRLEGEKARDAAAVGKVLDNAFLLEDLATQNVGLDKQLQHWLGRIPGYTQVRAMAEVQAREYMRRISQGVPQ